MKACCKYMRNRCNRCNKVLINVKSASERHALFLSGMHGSLKRVALWITGVVRGVSILESAEARGARSSRLSNAAWKAATSLSISAGELSLRLPRSTDDLRNADCQPQSTRPKRLAYAGDGGEIGLPRAYGFGFSSGAGGNGEQRESIRQSQGFASSTYKPASRFTCTIGSVRLAPHRNRRSE